MTRDHRLRGAILASSWVLLASACGANPSPHRQASPEPNAPATIGPQNAGPATFEHSADVDNRWLPLRPGTRLIYEGHAIDGGKRVRRRDVFTVTNLTKVIDGVRAVVVWDRDYTDGGLVEMELAFFAQDDAGNVWHFGEYPEEYEKGRIVKTPAWIPGLEGAKAGIAMLTAPRPGSPGYAQGWGPAVNWSDRARVYDAASRTCVPAACYQDVLITDEFNRDEPGAHQLKYYAPLVGNVRVGWRGAGEEEKEVLQLVKVSRLGPAAMARVGRSALEQEKRAYTLSEDLYGRTPPAEPTLGT